MPREISADDQVIKLDPTQEGPEVEDLERKLRQLIIGQDSAINEVVLTFQIYMAGMCTPGRPIASFLFLGPTGSGKTRLVEVLAQILVGYEKAVIKIDCAEFQHSHEIAKLVGSPPGYLGHRETHPLFSQEVLNQYHTETRKISFVLFDEIEKASDALWSLLLGILDKATLTLGDNRKVNFSSAMIFMTSNLGAREMNEVLEPKFGYKVKSLAGQLSSSNLDKRIDKVAIEAMRRKFTPEFVNRIDKLVVFHSLNEADLYKILDIELSFWQQDIFTNTGENAFLLKLTQEARDFVLKNGTDLKFGARPLKRAIGRLLKYPISGLILSGQIAGGDYIRIGFSGESGSLTFEKIAKGLSIPKMVGLFDEISALPPMPPLKSVAAATEAKPKKRS